MKTANSGEQCLRAGWGERGKLTNVAELLKNVKLYADVTLLKIKIKLRKTPGKDISFLVLTKAGKYILNIPRKKAIWFLFFLVFICI